MKNKEKIITGDLREELKSIMKKEIQKLPEILEGLAPTERINIVLKLMPFVFPKLEAVHPTDGEPLTW